MDPKTLHTLELPKILARLSQYTAFSASAALARALTPTADLAEARRWQAHTTEARKLLSLKADVSLGGAHDVRAMAHAATLDAVLTPTDLLDLKATLISARTLSRLFAKLGGQYPYLSKLAEGIQDMPGLVDAIGQTIDDRGEVLDSASPALAQIRREMRVVHDRLLDKLNRLLTDPRHAGHLQENLITQRDGRYVLPLKADFKGRLRGIVHDQSASGATLFIEPLATVELNNAWREKQLAEQQEIRRILAELSAQVALQADRIIWTVEALAELDLAFAKAKYADALRASEPILKGFQKKAAPAAEPAAGPPQPLTTVRQHPGSVIKLRAARHPLLQPDTVVPVDMELDDQTYALVITGPNTGGKTVSLKTVGLLALMAQCGLHLPAQSGSEISVFAQVFADIGDEQSIEQSLSTFSAHINNIIQILSRADEHALVILDELGAGTDPAEGSALARAILSYLLDMGATALVATHYPELKGYAHNTPGVKNASLEFDLETLQPTYHLTIGLPGRSNAFAIASRLGLEPSIIAEAKTMVTQTSLEAEELLDEIHRQRDVVRAERARTEQSRRDAEAREQELTRRLERIEDERRQILEEARRRAQTETESLRTELAELKRRLARLSQAPEKETLLHEVEVALETLEAQQIMPVASALPVETPAGKKRPLRLGDTVKIKTHNLIGVITTLSAADAEVQVGRMHVRAKLDELQLRSTPEPAEAEKTPDISQPAAPSPGLELDLRGQTVEEALPELERYLDAAYRAGLPWVRLIHGKGTGKLRQGVREFLRACAQVKSFATGEDNEGGEGVTVVTLVAED